MEVVPYAWTNVNTNIHVCVWCNEVHEGEGCLQKFRGAFNAAEGDCQEGCSVKKKKMQRGQHSPRGCLLVREEVCCFVFRFEAGSVSPRVSSSFTIFFFFLCVCVFFLSYFFVFCSIGVLFIS